MSARPSRHPERAEPGAPRLDTARSLFATSLEGVLFLDRRRAIVWMNPAAERLLGLPVADAAGQPVTGFLVGAGRLPRRHERGKGPVEIRARRADGATFTAEIAVEAVDLEGPRVFVCHVRETTVRETTDRHTKETTGRPCLEVSHHEIAARKEAEGVLHVRLRRQSLVAALSRRALGLWNVEELMTEALAAMTASLGVEYGLAALGVPPGAEASVQAAHGWPRSVLDRVAICGTEDSLEGFAVRARQPVVVPDWLVEQRFAPSSFLREHGVVSSICVPVAAEGACVGVLEAHARRARRFTDADVAFLVSIADIAAAAFARKREDDARRQLLEHAISAQDTERRRIACELHDETGQALTAVLLGLRAIEQGTGARTRRTVQELRHLLSRTIEEVGRLSRGLYSSLVEDLGLAAAAERHAQEYQWRLGIPIEVRTADLGTARLPAAVEAAAYRILQEALTNVARHARARRVRIGLSRRDSSVELTVEDDGIGFDATRWLAVTSHGGHLGLHGMREGAALLGGTVSVRSRPSGGTLVCARIPVGCSGAPDEPRGGPAEPHKARSWPS